MEISARNQLEGIIRGIDEGPMISIVEIEITPGVIVTAQITTASVRRLQLIIGKPAYALIKADAVMIGVN